MCMNVRIYLIYESNATCVGENLVDDLKVQKRYGNEVKSVE